MATKRTKKGQTGHDKELLKWVKQMESQGFDVKADLPGMEKPNPVGGKIPDGYAKKGKQEKMIEVETADTLATDADQRKKFRKWSDGKDSRTFTTKVIRKKGK